MTQLEDPANVDRWTDPHARNVFLVLRETGKRVSEVVILERNPILIDSTGAPCLLYRDQKGRRDGIVPISDTAAAAIADQQRLVAERWPTSPWLFPKVTANADGSRHYSSPAFNDQLDRWLTKCDIRSADSQPVKVTSHRFRHTLATRMLNLGVPQHIVQQMLGHVGADTVSTYAQLSDATMRAEFERYKTSASTSVARDRRLRRHLAHGGSRMAQAPHLQGPPNPSQRRVWPPDPASLPPSQRLPDL